MSRGICKKCSKPFHTIYAGRDEDFLNLFIEFTDFAYNNNYTDKETTYTVKRFVKSVKRRLEFPDKLEKLIREEKIDY